MSALPAEVLSARRGPTWEKLQACLTLLLVSSEMIACEYQKSTAPSLSKLGSVQAFPVEAASRISLKGLVQHETRKRHSIVWQVKADLLSSSSQISLSNVDSNAFKNPEKSHNSFLRKKGFGSLCSLMHEPNLDCDQHSRTCATAYVVKHTRLYNNTQMRQVPL